MVYSIISSCRCTITVIIFDTKLKLNLCRAITRENELHSYRKVLTDNVFRFIRSLEKCWFERSWWRHNTEPKLRMHFFFGNDPCVRIYRDIRPPVGKVFRCAVRLGVYFVAITRRVYHYCKRWRRAILFSQTALHYIGVEFPNSNRSCRAVHTLHYIIICVSVYKSIIDVTKTSLAATTVFHCVCYYLHNDVRIIYSNGGKNATPKTRRHFRRDVYILLHCINWIRAVCVLVLQNKRRILNVHAYYTQ